MHNVQIDLVLSLFILGATVLAFIYHVVLFGFNRDRFLVHYLIYLFFGSLFLFMKTGIIKHYSPEAQAFVLYYFREAVQILYLTAYFNFIVHAIAISRKKGTFLFRNWYATAALLVLYAIGYTGFRLFSSFEDYSMPFLISRLFIFGVTGAMLYRSFQLREIRFQLIILYGCCIFMLCGLLSFVTNLFSDETWLVYPMEWLMIGTFIDIVFFSLAIGYRNKKQWEELNSSLLDEANKFIALQQLMLEKQSELENERQRIAADMHDDLGSGLTRLTYLSRMAIAHPDSGHLDKIRETASELIGNMSELIWVMKEENNTPEDLATYIKAYAADYLEANGISLVVVMPERFPDTPVNGQLRRNLLLCVKEALHNVVKHARAQNVRLSIDVGRELVVMISDDGVGCREPEQRPVGTGNGIANMQARMRNLNGNMFFSQAGGTQVCFNIPLSKNVENEPFVPLIDRFKASSFAAENELT